MKHQHKRLCLKERWGMFAFVVVMMLCCVGMAIHFSMQKQMMNMYGMIAVVIVCIIVGIALIHMNIRRKRIQKEFSNEFDKDIRKKEVLCPKCGALMGASGICPKCGHCVRR